MKKILFTFLALFIVSTAHSAELAGVEFDDQVKQGSTQLVLNGLGLRTATVFKVKVYAAGLYLKEKNNDAQAVLTSESPKKIIMKFVRDVSAEKLANGWEEGFEKNVDDFGSLKDRVRQLGKAMPDAEDGDILSFDITGEGVKVFHNGSEKDFIKGGDFSKGLLSVWFGPKPPNEGLKKGMLGVK